MKCTSNFYMLCKLDFALNSQLIKYGVKSQALNHSLQFIKWKFSPTVNPQFMSYSHAWRWKRSQPWGYPQSSTGTQQAFFHSTGEEISICPQGSNWWTCYHGNLSYSGDIFRTKSNWTKFIIMVHSVLEVLFTNVQKIYNILKKNIPRSIFLPCLKLTNKN